MSSRTIKAFARLAAMTAVMSLWPHMASAQAVETMAWIVNGEKRMAIVHSPRAGSSGKLPLVLAFHGRGDIMENFQETYIHRAWPEAIVVYFQGLPSDETESPGWQVEQGQDGDRDLRLVDVALSELGKKFPVDDARIYATGFSNGGGFTYLLWAQRPAVFAAFAPVATRIRTSIRRGPKEPRPLFHVAGMRDMRVRFPDQLEAIERAKDVNGATGLERSCGEGCTIYRGAAPVMTWIHPGRHVWPPTTSERIAKFFRDHALKP